MNKSQVGWLVGLSLVVSACGGTTQIDDGQAGSGSSAGAPAEGGAPPGSAGTPNAAGMPAEAGSPSQGGDAGSEDVTECVWGNQTYPVGTTWKCDCNTCGCASDGRVWSTAVACAACTYEGKSHFPGEKFPSTDGCNTCECTNDGGVACTDKACACSADKDWNKQYAGTSPEQCAVIDYACSAPTKPFSNACGCGCEQDARCAEWIDCSPGTTSCAALKQKCPFSKIAQ